MIPRVLHKPRTLLGERLNEVLKDTYADVDLIALTIPADEKIGRVTVDPDNVARSRRTRRSWVW